MEKKETKKCHHEAVCEECIKEELAALEKEAAAIQQKIDERKKKLHQDHHLDQQKILEILKEFERNSKKEYVPVPYPVPTYPRPYPLWQVQPSVTYYSNTSGVGAKITSLTSLL